MRREARVQAGRNLQFRRPAGRSPALTQAGDDLRDQQLSAIGVDARVEIDAGGVHICAGVRTVLDMDAAGNLKGRRNSVGGEIEMSDAVGRIGVADDGVEEPHVEIACDLGLPVRVSEIVKRLP